VIEQHVHGPGYADAKEVITRLVEYAARHAHGATSAA
jgi:hypothetical protein